MATIAERKTEDGYTIRVFSSLYIDWGLDIMGPDGESVYYSPCCLSRDSYGFKPTEEYFFDWDEAEAAALDGAEDAFEPWDEDDWAECLEREEDEFLEAYLPDHLPWEE